ncbi:hypothetical protein A6F57_19815 [Alteromonas stellipolaris]|uniref:hypothetical protein n=1 Tax=Alteromonas stellipolaris TaxID=233316 RepID=UPI0007B45A58|nr:hypothetical protein [Alteromonas stellipolaris]ANB27228.1 hypothetical protein A6F57_19815 [Alteromonas stellipolaris]
MFAWFKRWRAERKMPKDETFQFRARSAAVSFGRWVIVELSGADCVVIMDQLNLIQRSSTADEHKGREVMALRYQAIAMSLRTKHGRVPLDWTNEVDLLFLASFPYSQVTEALSEIARVSDMKWLDPLYVHDAAEQDVEQQQLEPLSDSELQANPS